MASQIVETHDTSPSTGPVEPKSLPVDSPAIFESADDAVIRVRNLSKMYKIYPQPASVLKEVLLRKPSHIEHWALKDVSFDVQPGEIVGVIGANGAGKSTLLRILAGVLDATEGSFDIAGQLRAILQLGTGFHEQYTGMENIFMGGYCLGYTKSQIEESLDWILDFSDLRDVINQPFKTYSSGMRSRLTFAVTFCRDPSILIVDEALATGDISFQQKCVNRIVSLCSGGATALIVSHSMFFIEKLCSRALYIHKGLLVDDGPCRGITKRYERDLLGDYAQRRVRTKDGDTNKEPESHSPKDNDKTPSNQEPIKQNIDEDDPDVPPVEPEVQALLDDPKNLCPPILHLDLVKLVDVRILDRHDVRCDMFHTGDPLTVEIEVESRIHKDGVVIGLQIFHESSTHIATTTNLVQINPEGTPYKTPLNLRRGRQVFRVTFPALFLADGKYFISAGMSPKPKHFTEADQLLREKRVGVFGFHRSDMPWKVLYDPPSAWSKVPPPK